MCDPEVVGPGDRRCLAGANGTSTSSISTKQPLLPARLELSKFFESSTWQSSDMQLRAWRGGSSAPTRKPFAAVAL